MFLVPDNDVITHATTLFHERAKQPAMHGCVPELMQLLEFSPQVEVVIKYHFFIFQIRQLAGVILRRRIIKQWARLTPDLKAAMKHSLLTILCRDPAQAVQHAAAGVVRYRVVRWSDTISIIAKFEIPAGLWPELLQFLFQCCSEGASGQKGACIRGVPHAQTPVCL